MWERPQAWGQGQGSGWAGRSAVNRALRRREKRRASAHGLRVSVPARRSHGEPSLAQRLRSRAAPLQGHAAPRASPPSAHAGQAGWRRGALPTRGRNSEPVCAACPRPSLTERGLEGAQSCPLRWQGHLDPGGAPPVVGAQGGLGPPGLLPAQGWGLEGGAGCSLGFLLSHARKPLQPVCPPHKARLCPSPRSVWRGPDALPGGGLGSVSQHHFLIPPTPAQ